VEGARREEPGSRRNSRVYRITEDGKNWVEEHRHEVTLNSIDEAEAAIERLSERISDVSETTEELCEWRSESSGQLGGVKSRLKDLDEDIEELQYQVEKHDTADYNQRISDLRRKLNEVNTSYQKADNDLDQRLDTVESSSASHSRQIQELEQRISEAEKEQQEISEYLNSVETRLSNLENNGIWSRLRRWFTS
jgi:chromosome segregation ATPase